MLFMVTIHRAQPLRIDDHAPAQAPVFGEGHAQILDDRPGRTAVADQGMHMTLPPPSVDLAKIRADCLFAADDPGWRDKVKAS